MQFTPGEALKRLIPLLNAKKLVIFVGSGISLASGLPTWDGLLDELIKLVKDIEKALPPSERSDAMLDNASVEKTKNPTRVASVVKRRILELDRMYSGRVHTAFKQFFSDMVMGKKPNDNHLRIVSTKYPLILTSNYDNLLEAAAHDQGYTDLWLNSYSYNQAESVAEVLYKERPSIIHIHGKAQDVPLEDFVLTSEDYVAITRKYRNFGLMLHSILLTYSVLFVGYGGSDPHLEEVIDEMGFFVKGSLSTDLAHYFMLLRKDKVNHVLEKYKESLRTDIIVLDNYSQTDAFLEALKQGAPRK